MCEKDYRAYRFKVAKETRKINLLIGRINFYVIL